MLLKNKIRAKYIRINTIAMKYPAPNLISGADTNQYPIPKRDIRVGNKNALLTFCFFSNWKPIQIRMELINIYFITSRVN